MPRLSDIPIFLAVMCIWPLWWLCEFTEHVVRIMRKITIYNLVSLYVAMVMMIVLRPLVYLGRLCESFTRCRRLTRWLYILVLINWRVVRADVYMHNPRGSNNKLNEQSNNVENNKRLFDSQNNGRGGYQAGDNCRPACQDENQVYDASMPGALQGVMQFYEGSELMIEWTNQHGCGDNPRLHCNLVLQYMCDDTTPGLRDGTTRTTIPEDSTSPNYNTYGQHEPPSYYQQCKTRKRNKGLFTADQNMNGRETAIYTRQDNAGTRYGFECAEERDYYPYWHPTPWRDIYTCTDEPSRCSYYRKESQNVIDKGNCSDPQYNTKKTCESNLQTWSYVGKWSTPPPDCGMCPTTRNNHLGQTMGGESTPSYWWKIPEGLHPDGTKCVLRLRYNISTGDYDGWKTDSLFNGVNSPVTGNKNDDFLGLGKNISGPLTLNIDTSQFGRTFQDRSHVFVIRKVPENLKKNIIKTTRIVNLNVRGRRGNIVDVYPSVEYDFVPNEVEVKRGDYLHIQWTGSDANQRGNAGNGRDGTDRNNLVLMSSQGTNTPSNLSPDSKSLPKHFTNSRSFITLLAFQNQTAADCAETPTNANDIHNCGRLNAASAYFDAGLVRAENVGKFSYFSTRNNAFSNREQKATLIVIEDAGAIAAAVAIAFGSLTALGALSTLLIRYAHHNPTTKLGALITTLESKLPLKRPPIEIETPTPQPRWKTKLTEWWIWESQRFIILFIFILVNIAVWIYGYAINIGVTKAPYFPYAKGFGKALDVNCSFIILPVLRNILCYLRSTPLADIMPLDDNIAMHKLVFGFIAVQATLHALFHYLDFEWMARHMDTTVAKEAWGTLPGVTGHLIWGMMFLMAVTAFFNRKLIVFRGWRFDGYRTFLLTHKLWIPSFALLWLHAPLFWAFSLWPLCLILLEKLVQRTRSKVDVTILSATIIGSDILSLKLKLQSKRKFMYKAGEYLFLNCPEIGEEWHPFTITSAPEENFFGVCIRARPEMDWCYKLRCALGLGRVAAVKNTGGGTGPSIRKSQPLEADETGMEMQSSPTRSTASSDPEKPSNPPRLRVDGPYGSPSEEVFYHSTVILAGAGIGVTPFISILKSLTIRAKQRQNLNGEDTSDEKLKVYFYWICRDEQELLSFKDLLDSVLEMEDLRDVITVNTYTTGELNLKTVTLQKYNQYAGRPNWGRILRETASAHPGEEIGVFMCGPIPLARELSSACNRQNQNGSQVGERKTVFRFHKENF